MFVALVTTKVGKDTGTDQQLPRLIKASVVAYAAGVLRTIMPVSWRIPTVISIGSFSGSIKNMLNHFESATDAGLRRCMQDACDVAVEWQGKKSGCIRTNQLNFQPS